MFRAPSSTSSLDPGTNRFLFDASYYAQPAGLTSQPIRANCPSCEGQPQQSGFERVKYRDFTTTLGGPVVRDRLWFFGGYQHLRDYDSQPGSNPAYPRTYEQDKVLAKITWRLAPNWLLVQSFNSESLFNPQVPTATRPIEATQYVNGWVPVINFGHLTHTASANTVWEVRVGRLFLSSETTPPSGNWDIPNRVDRPGDRWSDAPQQVGQVKHSRTTAKGTVTHYWPRRFGAGHEWKLGAQVDGGEHRGLMVIPTGTWTVYARQRADSDALSGIRPIQAVSSSPPARSSAIRSGWEIGSRSLRDYDSTTAARSARTCTSSMSEATTPER